jgi:hypothetical protein
MSMLLPRWSVARDVFDLSASDNFIAPSSPMLFSVLSENEMKQQIYYLRLSSVIEAFDLSASDNFDSSFGTNVIICIE